MASSSNRAIEEIGDSEANHNAPLPSQEGTVGHFPDFNHPRTSESVVGNNLRVRVEPQHHMSQNTHDMNPHFNQMAEFFRHLAESMLDSREMNFEKMRKMGGVQFEGTADPTEVEQWLERMERVFDQLECSDTAKFKYATSLLQKDAYD